MLTLVTTVLVFAWRKQLRMAIAIVQEACALFRTMPSLMLFPFATVAAVVPICPPPTPTATPNPNPSPNPNPNPNPNPER